MAAPPTPNLPSTDAVDEVDEGASHSVWFNFLFIAGAGASVAAFILLPFWAAAGLLLTAGLLVSVWREGRVPWSEIVTHGRFQLMAAFSVALNPFVLLPNLAYNVGQVTAVARHFASLPNPASYDPPLTPRLPVEGTWRVVNGGMSPTASHSWFLPNQRYAYDLVIEDENGRSYEKDGTRPEHYFAFGRPVLSPADGTVVTVRKGIRDYEHIMPESGRIDWKTRDFRGNFVIIRHADGLYSFLAHLRNGSINVAKGDTVRAGEQIGECGNSGHSTEPHLHVHFQDRASFYTSAGLPLPFENIAINDTAQETAFLNAGDAVSPLQHSETIE